MHIFINHGLRDYLKDNKKTLDTPINIMEMGLGSGLNALLTAESIDQQQVDYIGIEAHPITEKATYLSYQLLPHALDNQLIESFWDAPWNTPTKITPIFSLEKRHGKIEDLELTPSSIDIIYYDAFAPGVNRIYGRGYHAHCTAG